MSDLTDEQLNRICKQLDHFTAISRMSDVQLSDAVLHEIWGKLPLNTREEFLLSELISRFEEAKGIERDEEGQLINKPTS